MNVIVNGGIVELKEGAGLKGLLEGLGLSDKRVAVELNRVILPRESYEGTALKEGDVLEIVGFVGGG
jgi:thiamine biosynthesis protein ThiS